MGCEELCQKSLRRALRTAFTIERVTPRVPGSQLPAMSWKICQFYRTEKNLGSLHASRASPLGPFPKPTRFSHLLNNISVQNATDTDGDTRLNSLESPAL